MADESLLTLAKEVRTATLTLIERLTDEQATFAALNNSILWHAGHALVVVEHLSILPLTGGDPKYPEGWFATFSWKSNPLGVTAWPTIEEVRQQLRAQFARLLTAIERATPEQLDRPKDATSGKSIRFSVIHGIHDEAKHQGEMWLLRKMLAKR